MSVSVRSKQPPGRIYVPFARTVLGDVAVDQLGVTNAHEHLAIGGGLITLQHPDYRLNDREKAIHEIRDFADAGGSTIVDATPCGVGREPDTLAAISRGTGVHVIGATGVHKESYYLDSHWRFRYSAEEIANLWQAEVEVGMEQSAYEGPIVNRSSARAGIVKVGSDYQNIASATVKAFEAAALVHTRTGVPVLTHSELGTMMLEQVELLHSFGVKPEHMIISHGDRNPDWFVHRDVAQTGAFIEYDCPGRVKYFPESTIVDLLRKMFELSLGNHILLGGDNARRSYWKAYGGGPGVAYLLRSFLPRLKREGFTEEQVQQLVTGNAAAAFAFADVNSEIAANG
jgi:predicted metal-dependent phosphotriesterase family hydrolase